MISMDAFIVLQCLFDEPKTYREIAAKRGVISVDNSIDELLRSGLVEQVGTDVAITKINLDKLNTDKLSTQSYKLDSQNKLNLSKYSDYTVRLSTLINHSAKMSNPAYRAVVDKLQPSRRDRAAQIFAQKLSAQDRPQFWKMFGKLNDTEQAQWCERAARLDNRSRGD
jgi:hypothetical protein